MIKYITLWDIIMKQFNSLVFLSVVEMIGNLEGQCIATDTWVPDLNSKILKEQISAKVQPQVFPLETLILFKKECLNLDLTLSAMTVDELIALANLKDRPTVEKTRDLYRELEKRVRQELQSKLLFSIEPKGVHYLEDEPFGPEVAIVFRRATRDIAEAGKCLAYDRWTAAVFHLSRIAEVATVTISEWVDFKPINGKKESFHDALEYIDSNLKEVTKNKKSAKPLFIENSKFLSKVSIQMHNVVTAWRNDVNHMDVPYTEEEAVRIWDTTRLLMQQLAKGLKGKVDKE